MHVPFELEAHPQYLRVCTLFSSSNSLTLALALILKYFQEFPCFGGIF